MVDHGIRNYPGGGYKQTPLLLVKGKNEHHEFIVNDATISFEDLDEGFSNLLNGCQGAQVFSAKEGDERVRTMYYTKFAGQCFRFDRTDPFIEFRVTGHAFDYNEFTDTGRRY